jgi:hypothetical protein
MPILPRWPTTDAAPPPPPQIVDGVAEARRADARVRRLVRPPPPPPPPGVAAVGDGGGGCWLGGGLWGYVALLDRADRARLGDGPEPAEAEVRVWEGCRCGDASFLPPHALPA